MSRTAMELVEALYEARDEQALFELLLGLLDHEMEKCEANADDVHRMVKNRNRRISFKHQIMEMIARGKDQVDPIGYLEDTRLLDHELVYPHIPASEY